MEALGWYTSSTPPADSSPSALGLPRSSSSHQPLRRVVTLGRAFCAPSRSRFVLLSGHRISSPFLQGYGNIYPLHLHVYLYQSSLTRYTWRKCQLRYAVSTAVGRLMTSLSSSRPFISNRREKRECFLGTRSGAPASGPRWQVHSSITNYKLYHI